MWQTERMAIRVFDRGRETARKGWTKGPVGETEPLECPDILFLSHPLFSSVNPSYSYWYQMSVSLVSTVQ